MSFYQVNSKQTERLYSKALEYAGLKGEENVWDIYCGIGTISLFLAAKAKKVYGVEIVPQAIENANNNAQKNNIGNAEFICGAAEEVLPSFYKNNGERPDVVVVDPPRKGCDKICLDTIINASPDRIVYVSCDPATLARDIKYLRENGYELQAYTPCDMFPNSFHVETVVLLGREKVDGHITIDLDVESIENKGGKATYSEIREYIIKKYGFKVSALFIAQTKDKAGIKERANYNIGSGKSVERVCPPDKEEAIMDAFRHFGLV